MPSSRAIWIWACERRCRCFASIQGFSHSGIFADFFDIADALRPDRLFITRICRQKNVACRAVPSYCTQAVDKRSAPLEQQPQSPDFLFLRSIMLLHAADRN